MSSWQLMPGEIAKTLTSAQDSVADVSDALVSATGEATVEPLQRGAGFDGVVLNAFAGFLEEQAGSRLQSIMNRYSAGLQATAAATNAYVAGDEEMAAVMVASAEAAATTGDFSRFQGGV